MPNDFDFVTTADEIWENVHRFTVDERNGVECVPSLIVREDICDATSRMHWAGRRPRLEYSMRREMAFSTPTRPG